jgi:hypothetical protein
VGAEFVLLMFISQLRRGACGRGRRVCVVQRRDAEENGIITAHSGC